jgi:Flp pilus assembly protein TadG
VIRRPGSTSPHDRRRRARGAVAVEAALVICFILVPLTMGIITYGYMLSFRQSISQAAAEGARAAAVAPASANHQAIAYDAISRAVGTTCNTGQLTCTATKTAPIGAAACDSCVWVTVDYAYRTDPSKPILMPSGLVPERLKYTAVAEISK